MRLGGVNCVLKMDYFAMYMFQVCDELLCLFVFVLLVLLPFDALVPLVCIVRGVWVCGCVGVGVWVVVCVGVHPRCVCAGLHSAPGPPSPLAAVMACH